MNFTEDYLSQAQTIITDYFKSMQQTLMAANGNIETQFKDDKTVVTALDKKMETELKRLLDNFDDSVGFEGEEFGSSGNRTTFWLVDPIDGTESFVRGLPFFRNMATLIDNGRPVFAVVYRVVSDETFTARKGYGAFKDGQKLVVSQRPLERCRIEVSALHQNKTVEPVLRALEKIVENIRTTDEFLFVVEGKLDAHLVYKSDPKPWDNAPRMLLMEETGAKVANIGSNTYDYPGGDWLAANPEIYDQIERCIIENQ